MPAQYQATVLMASDWYEEDYHRSATPVDSTSFLPGTNIEIVRPLPPRPAPQHVLFDFDGTLSLIREGWPDVMVPMMVEILRETGTDETPTELRQLAHDFVMQLNGKQTIYQMIRLAEEVNCRGGTPEEPQVYKQRYHDRLMRQIAHRHEQLQSGTMLPDAMMVPHAIDLLERLRDRGVTLYLASGTDEAYVLEETRLLGLDCFFGRHIYGALDDYGSFSKAKVIDRILSENRVDGSSLAGFGDGYVEIQNIKAVGGIAIAVASDESTRSGKPDPWKRDRLIGVGADLVIPDYQDAEQLVQLLCESAE